MEGRYFVKKIVVGLGIALSLLLLMATVAFAGPARQDTAGDECQDCHEELHAEWENSAHGQAASNAAFRHLWKEEGEPQDCLVCHATASTLDRGGRETDGIDCVSCHAPQPADHPDEIMPTASSAEACGSCHVDTFAAWQTSEHGEESLDCVNCHNPHTVDLKAASSLQLCQTCHNEESHFFGMTDHAQEGLICTDCHLRVVDSTHGLGEGHSQHLHTFEVDLKSCTQCHGDTMHYPVSGQSISTSAASPEIDQGNSTTTETATVLNPFPEQASSVTYFLALAVGLGLGVILAPGLEGLFHRFRNDQ